MFFLASSVSENYNCGKAQLLGEATPDNRKSENCHRVNRNVVWKKMDKRRTMWKVVLLISNNIVSFNEKRIGCMNATVIFQNPSDPGVENVSPSVLIVRIFPVIMDETAHIHLGFVLHRRVFRLVLLLTRGRTESLRRTSER